MRTDLSEWQNMKISVFYVNVHQRVEEGFNNEVDKMTPFYRHYTASFPSSSCGLLNKVAVVTVMKVIIGSATWTCIHRDRCGYSHC